MAVSLTKANTTATNRKKFTFSCWLKRGILSTQENFFTSIHNGSNEFQFRFDSDDEIKWQGSIGGVAAGLINTKRLFRDTSGWYNIVIAGDTTQSTNIDRLKLYINGEQIADGDLNTPGYPAQDTDFGFGTTDFNFCFGVSTPGTTNDPFSGIISHAHFIDGTAYAASTFGSTDATTGQWEINTSPTVTYGNNGFFILKNSNSLTDESGNANNFTLESGTLTNTEDCPSNVFATLNPLYNQTTGQGVSLANGNTSCSYSSDSSRSAFGSIGVGTGKYYFEAKLNTAGTAPCIGIMNLAWPDLNNASGYASQDSALNFGYLADGNKTSGGSSSSFGDTYTNGDIIGVAVDLTNSKLYFSKNGVWQNSGVPTSGATGTGSAFDLSSTATYTSACRIRNGGDWSFNFGNGSFGTTAISSEGTNASSIGKFEYDVPTGYTALSTKGLNL